MSLFRTLLGAIPTETTRTAARALDLLDEHRAAYKAARDVLATRGPLAALETFAAHTGEAIDDELVAQLRTGIETALRWSDVALTWVADAAVAMDGDRAKALIDKTRDGLTEAGYRASEVRHVVRCWLAKSNGPP